MFLVFDASALLDFLKRETGWEQVGDLLSDPANHCFAHAVNLHEVYRWFLLNRDPPTAQAAVQDRYTAQVTPRYEMDDALWQDAAALVARARQEPKATLATGDAFGLALARRLGAEFICAERKEIDRLVPLGFCPIRFVR